MMQTHKQGTIVRIFLVFIILILVITMIYRSQSSLGSLLHSSKDITEYSKIAIVILGGGLKANGEVYPHTELRIAKAAQLYRELKGNNAESTPTVTLVPLSGGTPHKPPPKDSAGFPIAEATAAVKVLLEQHHIPPSDIREEPYSVDTLGNAYFLRTLHIDPGQYNLVYIITNDWHMPRTQAMFQHVFDLPAVKAGSSSNFLCQVHNTPKLVFEAVQPGLSPDLLEVRRAREVTSLQEFQKNKHAYADMVELHTYMFTQHSAYAASRLTHPRAPLDKTVLATY